MIGIGEEHIKALRLIFWLALVGVGAILGFMARIGFWLYEHISWI